MVQCKCQVVQNLDSVDGFGKSFHGQHFVSDVTVWTEINVRVFTAGWFDLIQFNFFQGTFSGCCLFGFGSIGAEPGNKVLQFFDLFFFLFVGFFHLTDQKLAGFIPEVVVSGIELDLSIVDVCDLRADLV